ncbi:MAG: glycosyltransferase [Candidatus Moranbacteria bacterium]|nr:glycosyltransferase [Candidatus Moranbacteria bacterium]
MQGVSIVIPTLNEAENIPGLLRRVTLAFEDAPFRHELIFIDDRSTDGTADIVREAAKEDPTIRCYEKVGRRGKAQSLLEGFAHASYDRIAYIDADLQYPPEAIPKMVAMLDQGFDIVVADRVQHDEGLARTIASRGFQLVFSRFLHGLSCDVQSGLKVFKARIAKEVRIADPSPWTFDLEFLLSARNYGYVIGSVPIRFDERKAGKSKIRFFRAVFEIGWNAVKMRFSSRPPLLIHPENFDTKMVGAGVAHGAKRFVTHTTLHHTLSALETFAPWQWSVVALLSLAMLGGLLVAPLATGVSVLALLSVLYFGDTLFQLFLVLRSLKTPPELSFSDAELLSIPEEELPTYSVLCPLYREANMLPTFVEAMDALDWPKDRLDIMLLLEENDRETIEAAQAMHLPESFRIVVVPHSFPKTKPKACNYGLSLAKGEYVVIYDAEDIPDPKQLRKAYLGFQTAGDSVRCLQAKLNYFNPHQNLLTRFFTAEYSLWFDVVLPGLQSIDTTIPLGGTSNHFRTRDLLALEGWDPFNVTEDCDLGVRIFKRGFQTAIIDSVTLEEANSRVGNWLRQRSRWIKGYMQTYLVHMRDPIGFFRENGWHALIFQMVVGGKIAFMFINPILWIATISYFVFYAYVGEAIHALFPSAIFYLAATSLVLGNFLYLYYYMIGAAKRGHYQVVKYVFLVPLYWVLLSVAAFIALYQLLVKPHYWEKTTHGLHKPAKKASLDSAVARKITEKESEEPDADSQSVPVAGKRAIPYLGFFRNFAFGSDMRRKGASERKSVSMPIEWLVSKEGLFIYALAAASALNLVFNVYLGRVLSYEDFGIVALVNTVWYFTTILIGAFSTSINHRVAYFIGRGERSAPAFFGMMRMYAVRVALLVVVSWLMLVPVLSTFFHVDSTIVLALFAPTFLFGVLASGNAGYLQGSFRFSAAAAVIVVEALSKLVIAFVLSAIGFPSFAFAAIPASIAVSAFVGYLFVRRDAPAFMTTSREDRDASYRFPTSFFLVTALTNLSSTLFLSIDMLLVKHYLDPVSAGEYAILSLAGKMIFFFGSLASSFLLTYVSRNEGRSTSSRRILAATYAVTAALVAGGVIVFGVLGGWTVPYVIGEKAVAVIPYLLPYTLAMGIFTLVNVIVTYGLARRRYAYPAISILVSFVMACSIILRHDSLGDIVAIILAAAVAGLALSHVTFWFEPQHPLIVRALRDLAGVFLEKLPVSRRTRVVGSILILNWRDMRHDFAGGAEVYIEELARQWAAQGNRVTLFCGNDGKSPRSEIVNGVEIIRRGGFYLVYFWAFVYYLFRFRGRYDIVVDCHNGIPFFAPLYVRHPRVICLMHHVHQEVFRHSLPAPLAAFASFLEKGLMPPVYRNVRFITVSESSKSEMAALGLGERGGIHVIHPGIHVGDFAPGKKAEHPMVLYLGRLKAYKSVDVLLRAFQTVCERHPDAELVIAGDGEERRYLERLAADLRIGDRVRFLGRVSEESKRELLCKAWVAVNPSFMEGWGIVVIEANACGTPVIASDIPGLRDSVRDAATGYLVKYGDSAAFAEKISEVIRNVRLRENLGKNAREWAEGFDWRKSGEAFVSLITK